MTQRPDDYTSRVWLLSAATLLMLLIISFIPPVEAGGVSLRRASIISDLIKLDDEASQSEELQPEINIEEFEVDLEAVASEVAQTTATASPMAAETSASWAGIFDEQPAGESYGATGQPNEQMPTIESIPTADYSDILPADSLIVEIEDFGDGINSRISNLYEKLLAAKEPVRVAFMGDSFVEGDILSADLRELLQDTFGGGGAGFAPVASPFTGFRQTIKTQSKGWTPYNIMQRKNAPEPYASDFFVSGWVAQAAEGATTRWDMTDKRRHLEECNRARLLFICREDATVSITLNEGEEREFHFEGSDAVRQIVVEEQQIRSLEMKVKSGAKGFTGYGAEFDNLAGVAVDNFSIRSNNGQAMFWSNASVNAQINTMRPYDLVILQYGLNILQADRTNYSLYAEQVEKMIRYAEQCFPEAAILVMGVSDRSHKNEGGIVEMTSARNLSESQRNAAEMAGAAFWSTYDAMRKAGGMTAFVSNGWAGKDYTHINYAGGREIARALYYAILQGAQRYSHQLRERLEQSKPIITEPLQEIALPPVGNTLPPAESVLRDSTTLNENSVTSAQ
ncbi:MAG: hypothetical protein IKY82_02930 [Alistipes sp.]|nr:hypothetical protein [Alistipes sp.]